MPLPEVGMGCYRITSDMGVDRDTALATLHRAYERGVRFFDTAPLYGSGEADALLGEAFGDTAHDDIVIGAKLSGPTEDVWNYRYDSCLRSFDQTLKRLRRDSVQVLQIHGIPAWRDLEADARREWNDVFGKGMAYEALLRIREQGGCQYIGITSQWSPHLKRCLEHAAFDCVEIAGHYNLCVHAARETLLPIAEQTNTSVIVATPLAGGRLVSSEALLRLGLPNQGDPARAMETVRAVIAETGYTLYQIALLYVLHDPRVTCVIPGAANPAELDANLSVTTLPPLTEEQVERLRSVGVSAPFLKR
jgi:D-threo-aldose 1-dehydrogenase